MSRVFVYRDLLLSSSSRDSRDAKERFPDPGSTDLGEREGSLQSLIERLIALAHSHRVADRSSKSLIRLSLIRSFDRPCGTPFSRVLRDLRILSRNGARSLRTENKRNVPTRSAYAKVCRPLDWTLKSQK